MTNETIDLIDRVIGEIRQDTQFFAVQGSVLRL